MTAPAIVCIPSYVHVHVWMPTLTYTICTNKCIRVYDATNLHSVHFHWYGSEEVVTISNQSAFAIDFNVRPHNLSLMPRPHPLWRKMVSWITQFLGQGKEFGHPNQIAALSLFTAGIMVEAPITMQVCVCYVNRRHSRPECRFVLLLKYMTPLTKPRKSVDILSPCRGWGLGIRYYNSPSQPAESEKTLPMARWFDLHSATNLLGNNIRYTYIDLPVLRVRVRLARLAEEGAQPLARETNELVNADRKKQREGSFDDWSDCDEDNDNEHSYIPLASTSTTGYTLRMRTK